MQHLEKRSELKMPMGLKREKGILENNISKLVQAFEDKTKTMLISIEKNKNGVVVGLFMGADEKHIWANL
jgi:hypothetical protein